MLTAALAVVAVATFLQFTIGSGFGIVGVPLLLLVDPALVPGPMLLLTVVVMAGVLWRERLGLRHLDLGVATVAAVPAAVGAVWLTHRMNEQVTSAVVGVAVAVGLVANLRGRAVPQNRVTLALAGVLGGALDTVAAAAGPPVVLVYRTDDVSRYRANLALFFLVTSVVSLAAYGVSGDLGAADLRGAVRLVPGAVVGFAVARLVVGRIPVRAVQRAALLVCAFSTAVFGLVAAGA